MFLIYKSYLQVKIHSHPYQCPQKNCFTRETLAGYSHCLLESLVAYDDHKLPQGFWCKKGKETKPAPLGLVLYTKKWLSTFWSWGEAMAPHSSTLAWKIPWTEEPGRLQSMGSLKVGHNWATSLSLFTVMHWRRKWQPTLAFLPRESQGRGSLVGCRLWGRTESDTTEVT